MSVYVKVVTRTGRPHYGHLRDDGDDNDASSGFAWPTTSLPQTLQCGASGWFRLSSGADVVSVLGVAGTEPRGRAIAWFKHLADPRRGITGGGIAEAAPLILIGDRDSDSITGYYDYSAPPSGWVRWRGLMTVVWCSIEDAGAEALVSSGLTGAYDDARAAFAAFIADKTPANEAAWGVMRDAWFPWYKAFLVEARDAAVERALSMLSTGNSGGGVAV